LLGSLAAASREGPRPIFAEAGDRHRPTARPKGLDTRPGSLAALRLPRRESVRSVNVANLRRVAGGSLAAASNRRSASLVGGRDL